MRASFNRLIAMTSPRPQFQLYGRRKGKPLRRLHSELVENLLPTLALDMADPLFATPAPRMLEIGFGGGEHLAHQAALNPTINYIGAEPFLNGVAKLLAEIDTRKLSNLRVHFGDARPLLETLPAQCLERIYLLYPDPWPKKAQKKRRFINQDNLAHFARVLKPRGEFWFASDIDDYVAWTREHVAMSNLFKEEGDATTPFENWVQTRYEAKARREGRGSAYLHFRKI
jgi:tRNA (guanine-N7-)-methyltransferase